MSAERGATTSVPKPESQGNLSWSPEPEGNVEPMSEWTTAIVTWGVAWPVHQYGLGAAFATIAMLSMLAVVRLNKGQPNSNKRVVSVVLHGFLIVYGVSRCLFLCIDAYHHDKTMPIAVTNVLWGIAQPCLISSYTLLFVVLRNAIRLKQRFQTWFNARNIALVVAPHFLFVFISEITVSFAPRLKFLTFICQLFYVLLSLMLSLFYFYVAFLIWKTATKITGPSNTNIANNAMFRIFISCLGVAFGGLAITIPQLWLTAGPFSIFSNNTVISAWPWYISATSMRILEITMATILLFVARHQSRSSRSLRMPISRKSAWKTAEKQSHRCPTVLMSTE